MPGCALWKAAAEPVCHWGLRPFPRGSSGFSYTPAFPFALFRMDSGVQRTAESKATARGVGCGVTAESAGAPRKLEAALSGAL